MIGMSAWAFLGCDGGLWNRVTRTSSAAKQPITKSLAFTKNDSSVLVLSPSVQLS